MSEGAKRGWIELGMPHDCTPSLQATMTDITVTGALAPKIVVLVGSEDKVETVERVQKETVEPWEAAGWNVSMRVIEGAGHLLPVEAVREVVDAVKGLLCTAS